MMPFLKLKKIFGQPAVLWQEMRASFRLAIVLSFTFLTQHGLMVTDSLMLGRYSTKDFTGQALALAFYSIFIMITIGISLAVTPMVSQANGQGDKTKIRHIVRQGFWICFIFGTPLSLAVIFFSKPLLLSLGQTPEMVAIAADYLQIIAFAYVPVCMTVVCRNFMVALNRPNLALVISLVALVFNAVFDYVLIFGKFGFPEMGLRGSAIASVLSILVMLCGYIIVLTRREPFKKYHIFQKLWKADFSLFYKMLRLGVPIAISILFEELLLSASAFLVGSQGIIQLGAHSIALELVTICFMIVIGLTDAAVTRVGHAFGAQDWDRVRPAGWGPILMVTFIVITGALVMMLFPTTLAYIFLDPNLAGAPEILDLSQKVLFVAAFFLLFDGFQVGVIGALHGLSDTVFPMWGSIVSLWGGGLVTGYVLGVVLGQGVIGVWIGLGFGAFLCAVFFTIRFYFISVPYRLKQRAKRVQA